MKNRLKTFLLGGLMTGALLATTGQVFANDYWYWSKEHNRWDHRADLRSDYHDLEEAKRQLAHDRSHHASLQKLAEDEARIRDIDHDIHADRH